MLLLVSNFVFSGNLLFFDVILVKYSKVCIIVGNVWLVLLIFLLMEMSIVVCNNDYKFKILLVKGY